MQLLPMQFLPHSIIQIQQLLLEFRSKRKLRVDSTRESRGFESFTVLNRFLRFKEYTLQAPLSSYYIVLL